MRTKRGKPSRVDGLSRAHKMGDACNLQVNLYLKTDQKSSTERLDTTAQEKEQWLPDPGEKILLVGESDRSLKTWIHNAETGALTFIPSPYLRKGGSHA